MADDLIDVKFDVTIYSNYYGTIKIRRSEYERLLSINDDEAGEAILEHYNIVPNGYWYVDTIDCLYEVYNGRKGNGRR